MDPAQSIMACYKRYLPQPCLLECYKINRNRKRCREGEITSETGVQKDFRRQGYIRTTHVSGYPKRSNTAEALLTLELG